MEGVHQNSTMDPLDPHLTLAHRVGEPWKSLDDPGLSKTCKANTWRVEESLQGANVSIADSLPEKLDG